LKKLLLFFSLIPFSIFSQTTFTREYGVSVQFSGKSVVRPAIDNGYVIAGTAGWDTTYMSYGYLIKTDFKGDTLWTKGFGNDSVPIDINNVIETSDAGYLVTGQIYFPADSEKDIIALKTDTAGNVQWMQLYKCPNGCNGYCVSETSDGDYIFLGKTRDYGDGSWNVYMIKTDDTGNVLWAKTYGGSGAEEGYSVTETSDNGYIICGESNSSGAGNYDVLLIRTDRDGNVLWANTYGGVDDEESFFVKQTVDGGFLTGGYTASFGTGPQSIYLLKTDSAGALQWSKTYGSGSYDNCFSMCEDGNGDYTLCVRVADSLSTRHITLMNVDTGGNVNWINGIWQGGDADNICRTTDGGYIVMGTDYNSTNSFLVIKSDDMGNTACSNTNVQVVVDTANTQSGSINISVSSGYAYGNGFIGFRQGLPDSVVCLSVSSDEIQSHAAAINIYPNPFRMTATLMLNHESRKYATLKIYNTLGSLVKEQAISGQSAIINREGLENGIYFIRVSDGEHEWMVKVVVE
jgi:hypothetical protein